MSVATEILENRKYLKNGKPLWMLNEVRLIWVFIFLNLVFHGTFFIQLLGESSFIWFSSNYLLNFVPVGLILWYSFRANALRFVPRWLVAFLVAAYLISITVNILNNTRLMGCTLFLLCLVTVFCRPQFFAILFVYLVEKASWIALVYGSIVVALNYPFLRLDFYYPKLQHGIFLPLGNPNMLCQPLDIIALLLASGIVRSCSKHRKAILYISLLGISNLIFATASRSGIIQLVVVLLIVVISDLSQIFRGKKLIFGAVIAVLAFAMAGSWVYKDFDRVFTLQDALISQYGLKRFQNADITEYRIVTTDALYQFFENPKDIVLGRGAGMLTFKPKYFYQKYDTFGPHNAYVGILVQYGVFFFGALCIIFLRVYYIIASSVIHSRNFYLFLLLLACMIHPIFEIYYFFRYGVACDLVRLSLLSFLLMKTRDKRRPIRSRKPERWMIRKE